MSIVLSEHIEALQTWLEDQEGFEGKASDAAQALGITEPQVMQAALDAYWLGYEKRDGVAYVYADGE